jgi:DNA-binding HxlR family transcriptional regulator
VTEPLDPEMFADCADRADRTPLPVRVGDKWTAKILVCLRDAPRRFSELQVPLAPVTPKVLTESLRAMERDGLLTRTAYPGIPPRVEYALTALGRSLFTPLAASCSWNAAHGGELRRAREAYAERA